MGPLTLLPLLGIALAVGRIARVSRRDRVLPRRRLRDPHAVRRRACRSALVDRARRARRRRRVARHRGAAARTSADRPSDTRADRRARVALLVVLGRSRQRPVHALRRVLTLGHFLDETCSRSTAFGRPTRTRCTLAIRRARPLWQYLFNAFLPASEGNAYFAQFVLLLAPLLVLWNGVRWSQPIWIVAILALVLLAIANFGLGVSTLYVDQTIGVWYLGTILAAIADDNLASRRDRVVRRTTRSARAAQRCGAAVCGERRCDPRRPLLLPGARARAPALGLDQDRRCVRGVAGTGVAVRAGVVMEPRCRRRPARGLLHERHRQRNRRRDGRCRRRARRRARPQVERGILRSTAQQRGGNVGAERIHLRDARPIHGFLSADDLRPAGRVRALVAAHRLRAPNGRVAPQLAARRGRRAPHCDCIHCIAALELSVRFRRTRARPAVVPAIRARRRTADAPALVLPAATGVPARRARRRLAHPRMGCTATSGAFRGGRDRVLRSRNAVPGADPGAESENPGPNGARAADRGTSRRRGHVADMDLLHGGFAERLRRPDGAVPARADAGGDGALRSLPAERRRGEHRGVVARIRIRLDRQPLDAGSRRRPRTLLRGCSHGAALPHTVVDERRRHAQPLGERHNP